MAEHAVTGELVLQACAHCQQIQYPPREVCGACLGELLIWKTQLSTGKLLAKSELHNTLEPCFKGDLPWTVVSVLLDCGPVVLARFEGGGEGEGDGRVTVTQCEQEGGSWILQALPIRTEEL